MASMRALFISLDSLSSLDRDVRMYSPSDSLQWRLKGEPPRRRWSDFSESMVWVDPTSDILRMLSIRLWMGLRWMEEAWVMSGRDGLLPRRDGEGRASAPAGSRGGYSVVV